jgi:amino acid adenylation domain-containing protein
VEDTQPKALLIESEHLFDLLDIGVEIISLDIQWEDIQSAAPPDVEVSIRPDQLAYIMYTSGSTGRPKGVQIEHHSILRLIYNQALDFLNEDSVICQFAALSFDAATFEIWGALLKGGKLVIREPGLQSLEQISDDLKKHQVDTLYLTAALFHLAVDTCPALFSGLSYILAGGDSIYPASIEAILRQYPDLVFLNGYGPTEVTTFAIIHRLEDADQVANERNIIGRPISNTTVSILDKGNRKLQPVGVIGEICLGGAGLSRAYLGRDDLNATKFINDPHRPGQRLYRTGDLGRWLENGQIEFFGRLDNQVKIRGFRVEPDEVSALLDQVPGVQQSLVLVKTDDQGQKRLIGYVVAAEVFDQAQAFNYLEEHLPDYQIPSLIMGVAEIKLTTNGKIDRRSLPDPDLTTSGRSPYEAPRTDMERQMVQIWEELLGQVKVGIQDNFFDLGGHSLLATRLISSIKKEFSMNIPIVKVFQFPCIADLAGYMQLMKQEEEESSAYDIIDL